MTLRNGSDVRHFLKIRRTTSSEQNYAHVSSGINQPPLQLVPNTLSSEVKQPGHKDFQSSPSGTEVKNAWNIVHPYISLWLCVYLHTGANLMLCIPCGFHVGTNYVIKHVYSVIIYIQEDMRTETPEQNSLPPTTRQ
jgi:hypothetical protein